VFFGTCVRAGGAVGLSLLFFLPSWAQQSAADKLIAAGHYRRAQPLVQATLDKHPQDIDALVALSTIQWAFGQLDAATTTAERALRASDGSAAAHAQMLNILGAKLASPKFGTFDKMGLSRRFHQEADRTLQLDPGNPYAHEALARFYWYAPVFAGGSKAKARQWVDKLIQLDPARGYALKAELDTTESDKGIRCSGAVQTDWTQAVTANPASYLAHAGLGDCLLTAESARWQGAEDEARKALALDPSRINAYRILAVAYVATARWDNLEANLKRARAAVPDDLGAEFIAAQTILDRHVGSQWTRAEECLRHYLNQPNDGLEPTAAVAHWRLGNVLEKEGRKSAALQELGMALALDPSQEGAKKDLKRLQ
jgi:tetratricopeptide (TPR) repeat protein